MPCVNCISSIHEHRLAVQALRVAAQAVHICPWAASLWGAAAARALDHSHRHAPAAAHICRQPALNGLHRAARSYSSQLHANRLPPETVRQAQHVRAVAFVAQAHAHAARTAAADFKASLQGGAARLACVPRLPLMPMLPSLPLHSAAICIMHSLHEMVAAPCSPHA